MGGRRDYELIPAGRLSLRRPRQARGANQLVGFTSEALVRRMGGRCKAWTALSASTFGPPTMYRAAVRFLCRSGEANLAYPSRSVRTGKEEGGTRP
jgi:hypothetical protein